MLDVWEKTEANMTEKEEVIKIYISCLSSASMEIKKLGRNKEETKEKKGRQREKK